MKAILLDTPRTRRHHIAGLPIDILGRKSGTIYFMIERNDYAEYFSVDEESLGKHAVPFDTSQLATIPAEDLLLISKTMVVF